MEVITTHVNADFDAFASMVAAHKLYPDAVMAFPGSQEKHLRDFFIASAIYILSIERAKDIDLSKVKRLILVDTRQKQRIGRFAELVDNGALDIHIYDHHPDSADDAQGSLEVVREVGATVTLLIQEMRKREIDLNAEEATLLALGLYEDTGSFTFTSTTPDDLEAAAWLVQQGANLNVVAHMMPTDLNRGQIEVLHQLIEETELITIGGVEIVVATAGADGYIGDLAILVHKYKDIENLKSIFAVIRMEDRLHLIARSSIDDVNCAEIASEFGGGGHAAAASATIRNMTLYEAKDRLIKLLNERVRPKRLAQEIMSRPVYTIEADHTIEEASELLSRYQISSLPVMRNHLIFGILHRNAVEKALHHGLKFEPVEEFTNPGTVFVTPEEPIENVLRIAVDSRLRLVPVLKSGDLVGVISRSDLLEHLRLPRESDSTGPDEFPISKSRTKSVRKLMEERLPQQVLKVLRLAGEIAVMRREEVYLVGGAVRDLLLRNYNLDIDLVVEGQGIPFARELAEEFPRCRVRDHEKFGTAVMLFDDGFKVDVATARHEYYASPGALPTVETSSIKRDLFRRDFTINTLAVSLNPRTFGKIIDFFGGSRDIKDKAIRVLHNLAFVEDPTRILRAVRFSSRFDFNIGKHTAGLITNACRMMFFDKVEGKRLLNELIHILDERKPLPALNLMASYAIPEAIHPQMRFTRKSLSLAESVSGVLAWWKYQGLKDRIEVWIVYMQALTDGLSDGEFSEVCARLSIVPHLVRQMLSDRNELKSALALMARGYVVRPSEIAAQLRPLSLETLLFTMAKTGRPQSREAIAQYINVYRNIKPILTGRDLIQMGYKPGPLFGEILSGIRDEKLNGNIATSTDEITFVKSAFPLNKKKTIDLESDVPQLDFLI